MLKRIKPESLDVLSTFLERKEVLPEYNTIVNTITDTTIYRSENSSYSNNNYLYCIYDFPSYLKGIITKKNWKLKVINTYKGSLILLKNYKNTEDYLKQKFSAGRRSKFRTYQKRLETCFNIEYKTYFGNISKDEYDLLFEALRDMTKARFSEKKMQNYDLPRWHIYHDIAYPLINSKEAVLFVVFSDGKPISICLNLVRGKTIYGYIRAFNIDYSKFYIGFTDFINQLKWCFSNKIEVFDLVKGIYPYKLRLIDIQYDFQKHILYNSSSFSTIISAKIIIFQTLLFYRFIELLKKIKINKLYYKLVNYKYQIKKLNIEDEDYKIPIIIRNAVIASEEQLLKVDLNKVSSDFLKRTVYNFLYANQESLYKVEIFKIKNEIDSYFIKGENQVQKIIFNSKFKES